MEGQSTPNRRDAVEAAAFGTDVAVLLVLEVAIAAALYFHWYPLVVVLVLVASHFMHGTLIGFHEASHGLLRKNRTLNEIDGILIGIFSLMSFSLYRAAHQTHHAGLGTERDEELWPFVKTDMPRWARVGAAILELTCGILFTPFIFFRAFLRKDSPIRSRRVRRRIWAEIGLIVGFWVVTLTLVAAFDLWIYFLCMYLIPAVIAGNLQSLRKYIEHVGMTGNTVNGLTRNIVPKTRLGRILAFTLLHEPYHGVHHQNSGLPHAVLPQYADTLEPASAEELPPFPSYWSAFRHLWQCLADPQVGPQWRKTQSPIDSRVTEPA